MHNPTIKTCLVAPRILVVSILLFSDATVLRAAPAGFDPVAETERLLASGPAGPWAQSDAYSEGGCWLQLWGPLVTCLIARLLYRTGWATGLRNLAELPVLIAGFVLFLLLATPGTNTISRTVEAAWGELTSCVAAPTLASCGHGYADASRHHDG